jgi:alanyl-tRNA synthetase
LLDAALRQVLGTHVEQKGSYVSGETLRFDFSHYQKVTDEELRQVERIVNAKIREDIPLQEHRNTPLEEAKKMGAIALFGEKYGDKVRVIQFAESVEFCGGIHVKSTGHIGMFKIVSESSVAAGVRRIEAITGKRLEDLLYTMEDTLKGLRAMFNNAPDLMATVQKFISEHDGMKKEVEKFQAQAVENIKDKLLAHAETYNGIKIVRSVMPMSASAAKDLVFKIRAAVPERLLCVIGTVEGNRPLLSVMISEDLVKEHNLNAGALVREASKLIQGGGGGQPHYATAGGKNADGLHAAVDKVLELAKG